MHRYHSNAICVAVGVLSLCLLISPLCAEQKQGASDCLNLQDCSAEEVEDKLFVRWRGPTVGLGQRVPPPEPKVILFFGSNSDGIAPEYQAHIDKIGQGLIKYDKARIWIEGHTDSAGPDNYNLQLSENRAWKVKTYLLDKFNTVSAERVIVRGYGESRPIAPNATQEGQKQNRRVEFVNHDLK